MNVLIDSSVWIDFFNGKKSDSVDLVNEAIDSHLILMGDLIYAEILSRFKATRHYQLAKSHLDILTKVELAGFEQASRVSMIYRDLRSTGITVRKTIDVFIASYCMHTGCHLLHSDRDFVNIGKRYDLKFFGT